eukprot:gene14331-21916_t
MYTATTIGGDGLPAMSSYDPTRTQVRFVHCNDAGCGNTTAQ